MEKFENAIQILHIFYILDHSSNLLNLVIRHSWIKLEFLPRRPVQLLGSEPPAAAEHELIETKPSFESVKLQVLYFVQL
jgi:hypothetical protein